MYYLDDEKSKREARGGPTILSRFRFKDRGIKIEPDDLNNESDLEIPNPPVRISFRNKDRG